MGYLRFTDTRPDAEIRKLINSTVADAEKEWSPLKYEGFYPVAGFGLTEIRPRHINSGGTGWANSTYWSASIATSLAFFDWTNITLTDMAYVMVTGLFNRESSPKVIQFAPSANGEDLPTVDVEQMYTLDVARAWWEKPYSVRPNNMLRHQLMGDNTGSERIGLLGYTIAKRAFLISRTV